FYIINFNNTFLPSSFVWSIIAFIAFMVASTVKIVFFNIFFINNRYSAIAKPRYTLPIRKGLVNKTFLTNRLHGYDYYFNGWLRLKTTKTTIQLFSFW